MWLFLFLFVVAFLAALSMGYSSLPLDRILQVLSGNGVLKENYYFYQIRLHRAMVLTMAGA